MFGILVHDTKFDKVFKLAVPAAAAAAVAAHALDIGGHAHTHVERVSLGSTLANSPAMQPRDDHRRYISKKTTRTDDFFGGSKIMWPSF